MIKNIKNYVYKKKFNFLLFAVLSILFNIVSIMPHVADIVHIIPVTIFYDLLASILKPININPWFYKDYIYILLAAVIDGFIGIIIGGLLNKFFKKECTYLLILTFSFLFYWFVITYQWLFLV